MNDGEIKSQAPAIPADELKRLADFFALLVQIDQRIKRKGKNERD